MRDLTRIKTIILHHTASDIPEHDNMDTIREWHLAKGFDMEGYHYLVRKSGLVELGRPLSMQGAHCYGHNEDSIGIALSGLKEFTPKQFNSCAKLCVNLYQLLGATVKLHKDITSTECPNFDLFEIQSRMTRIMNAIPTTTGFFLYFLMI